MREALEKVIDLAIECSVCLHPGSGKAALHYYWGVTSNRRASEPENALRRQAIDRNMEFVLGGGFPH